MRDFISWSASLPLADLSAWGTVVSAAASLALVVFTFWLAVLTRTLARETRLSREAGEKADVQCSVEPHEEHVVIIEFIIANLGRASAVNVVASFGPVRPRPDEGPARTLSFARLMPGTRVRLSLGSYADMPQKVIRADISFEDKFGSHKMHYEQDLELWLGLSQVSNKPGYAMAQSLSQIERILRDWSTSANYLKVDTFTSRDRTQHDKDLQMWIREQSKKV